MPIPIISIVGKSNSGKTTLIEKVIRELKGRGYRIATIKHNIHGFEIDHEGKDSYRHKHAGADISIIASPEQVAIIRDIEEDYSIDKIIDKFIDDVDLILTEGFKGNDKPKIEVYRESMNTGLLCTDGDNILAIATDAELNVNLPRVDINNIRAIADIIENEINTEKHQDKL